MAENDENSILDDVKKILMIGPTDTSFDLDVIIAINTAFVGLHGLGVGPVDAFQIEDKAAKWSAFIGAEKSMASVKSYIALRTKQLFDLNATSYVISAREKQIDKLEWQLQVEHDRTAIRSLPDPLALLTP